MSASPNLQLPFLDANQNQKHVTHNAALSLLDILVGSTAASTTLATPPPLPGDGQCWIVATGGTGAWAGKDGILAAWQDGAWTFVVPRVGMTVFASDRAQLLAWTGSAWAPAVPVPTAATIAATSLLQALIFG